MGSGLCSPPLIRYLADHNIHVTVGNRTVEHAKKITDGLKNAEAIALDIEKPEGVALLEQITPQFDGVSRSSSFLKQNSCSNI